MTTQLDRIRYVTEHYADLQGLRLLPLSLPFFVAAWWDVVPSMKPTAIAPMTVELALIALALALSFPIRRYYEQRFGTVPALPWRSGVLPLFGCALLCVLAEAIREFLSWTFPVPLLVVSVLLIRLGLQAGHLRGHYLWIAAACVAFVGLGRLAVPLNIRAMELDLLIAIGLLAAALGDHRALQRALRGTYAR
jgi:hypothetical protein